MQVELRWQVRQGGEASIELRFEEMLKSVKLIQNTEFKIQRPSDKRYEWDWLLASIEPQFKDILKIHIKHKIQRKQEKSVAVFSIDM